MDAPLEIDSIESIYQALNGQDEVKAKALLMLMLRNWLTEVSSFDPVSGHALHTDMVDFLDTVAKSLQAESPEREIKDRIYRIVSHTKDAVLAIMEHTRDKILREHTMLPIHAAREVDSNSVQWLSRQPGRTLREKLSGKPYMKAVRRRSSVDTAENRLLRAFLFRLEQILIERQNVLSAETEETCEELLVSLHRWLRTEDAAEIGAWGNLPPNNTLLQDKRYRKVWDGWLWLQSIDDQITGDDKRIHRDILSVIYWYTLSLLNLSGRFRTVQQPIGLGYDNFAISPELPVRGYLFPACDSKIKGKIKFIKPDKSFGFITSDDGRDLYFNPYNLSRKLDVNSLSAGDEVSFVLGSNRQGECADDITLPAGIIPVDFNLTGDKWKIQVGEDKYLLQIVSGNLVIEQVQAAKNRLKIDPATLKDIPKAILSFVTDTPFQYSEQHHSQRSSIRMDSSVVDLCAIRPAFTNNTGSKAQLPFRLLLQIWTLEDGTKHTVDCGRANAIVLRDDIETISMRSLFSHSSTLPDATKSSASMFFTKKLSDYIKIDKLTYLVTDWGNDFDLEGIRKSVNFYFDESTPLPKSIAAIFAWQSSAEFKHAELNNDSKILVIDSFYGGFSVTPVTVHFSQELKNTLSQTKGFTWVRHPTFLIKNKKIFQEVTNKLNKAKCPYPENILQLFGLDGLFQDVGKLTIEKDAKPFHVSHNIGDVLDSGCSPTFSSNNHELTNYLKNKDRNNTFVLPISRSTTVDPLLKDFNQLSFKEGDLLTEGALTLNDWQDGVNDIALWRDHLPELSIRIVRDGRFENFYLVKDATVTPQRGRTVNIPVEELFTLPARQTHYSFPLQQGEGNKELQFVAYLKSPAFPLKKAIACKLKMTYTYGADDPYELKFIPKDSAESGFKSIRVEWRSASEGEAADLENLPVPDFPVRKSWSDFQNFPKENGKSFSDLLEWLEREMIKISDIERYGRVVGTITKWIDKGNGNIFCFIDDTFIHQSSIDLKNEDELPGNGEELSFYKIKNKKEEYSAFDVAVVNNEPKHCFLSKSHRFPALTIWNHGHSLSEPDVPEHFRNAIFESIQKIISIIESENMPDTLKEELFFFLCCLHKDAPGIVGSRLLDAVKDKTLLRRHHKNIAFAIGDAELLYQQELLENVIDPIDNEGLTRSITMEVLSIALWRSKTLINKLTKDDLVALSRNLYGCLEFDLQKVVNDRKGYQISTLCKHLELLLALLRSRGIEGEEFKMIFAPDNDLTRKYVALIDDVSTIVIDGDIELKSRISLQIEKPEMFHNTPDLLYALRMYLTGGSGANTIVITGVIDE